MGCSASVDTTHHNAAHPPESKPHSHSNIPHLKALPNRTPSGGIEDVSKVLELTELVRVVVVVVGLCSCWLYSNTNIFGRNKINMIWLCTIGTQGLRMYVFNSPPLFWVPYCTPTTSTHANTQTAFITCIYTGLASTPRYDTNWAPERVAQSFMEEPGARF